MSCSKLFSIKILLILSIMSNGCQPNKTAIPNDKVVASVENRELYASDLKRIIHPNTSPQDSLSLANAFIDQWIMDQLMTREASRHFSSDFEIEKLVDDYREKLLKYNLEENIIEMRFDTIVDEVELYAFYNKMKEQFYLKEDIYRCIFAQFKVDTIDFSDFNKAWEEDDNELTFQIIGEYATSSVLDSLMWIEHSTLSEWNSGWNTRNLSSGRKQSQSDEKYEYYLKILNKKDKGDISPLEYIRPQLRSMLLHRRKQSILEEFKQELYESALNRNLIKFANSESD